MSTRTHLHMREGSMQCSDNTHSYVMWYNYHVFATNVYHRELEAPWQQSISDSRVTGA